MDVQRWEVGGCSFCEFPYKDQCGDYVRADDHRDAIAAKDAEIASLRRALWWLHAVTGADIFYIDGEDRDIHEEALEIAYDRGADDATPDDYIAALVVLSEESAALTEGE